MLFIRYHLSNNNRKLNSNYFSIFFTYNPRKPPRGFDTTLLIKIQIYIDMHITDTTGLYRLKVLLITISRLDKLFLYVYIKYTLMSLKIGLIII